MGSLFLSYGLNFFLSSYASLFLNFVLSTMPLTPAPQPTTVCTTLGPLTSYLCSPDTGWGGCGCQQANTCCSCCGGSYLATQWLVPQPVLVRNRTQMWNNSLFNGAVRGALFPLGMMHFPLKCTLLLPFNT